MLPDQPTTSLTTSPAPALPTAADFDTVQPSPHSPDRWWLPAAGRELTDGTPAEMLLDTYVARGKILYDREYRIYIFKFGCASIRLQADLPMRLRAN